MSVWPKKRHGPIRLRVIKAQEEDLFSDEVRVTHAHRPFSKAGQIIVVRHGNKWIPAAARGALNRDSTTIQLDLASRQRLGLKPNVEAEFTFESARLWAHVKWGWTATHPVPRIATQLGAISVGLGVAGALLGILSLALTLCQR